MAAWKTLRTAQDTRDKYYDGLPTVMVMEELAKPRQSFILNRGEYDKPGKPVQSKLPGFLVPAAAQAEVRAEPPGPRASGWSPADNPLMARVTVNRFWQQYFGTGIVRTSEDFGSQGEAPSHPELLDWLAVEFRESELGREEAAAADRAQRHVPAGVDAIAALLEMRSGEPAAGARPERAPVRGDDPRPGAGHRGPAGGEGGWPLGVSLPARRHLARPELLRGLHAGQGRGPVSAAACTPSGSAPSRRPRW